MSYLLSAVVIETSVSAIYGMNIHSSCSQNVLSGSLSSLLLLIVYMKKTYFNINVGQILSN
ncbi:hypothetical protein B4144_2455 [Bacillus atrophaeus]|nr:hypothetical protein B4144_2455 [Bacillus atrophaeus]